MASKKQLRELKALIAELGSKLGEVSEDTKDELLEESAELMEAFKEKLTDRVAMARERGRQAMEQARAAGRQADEYIHENPWHVAAGAAVLGILIGLMMSGKRRD